MNKDIDENMGKDEPFCIAVLAVGGQGGGVLSNWLVSVAEIENWVVQVTSVPGVAQRTGATIYYLEMIQKSDKMPILGLIPSPGFVDLVVATELMEAGRAIQRGLVSPDKTCLLASTHRNYAVAEKIMPGDGIADPDIINMVAQSAAKKFIGLDLAAIAEKHHSVISASSLGAIAASNLLPFAKETFQKAIEKSGVGVENSLKAFEGGWQATTELLASDDAVEETPAIIAAPSKHQQLAGGRRGEQKKYQQLLQNLAKEFPSELHQMIIAGLNRVIDFHNVQYGQKYVDILTEFFTFDGNNPEQQFILTENLAKYLANAMSYQDVIRVADLKIRQARLQRITAETQTAPHAPLAITEFMHPRVEEMQGLIPYRLRFLADSAWMRFLLKQFAGSKRLRSDRVGGFLLLYFLAHQRRRRLGTIRHQQEWQRIEQWLQTIKEVMKDDYLLAVEMIKMQRLIKGYSDTHHRTSSKYHKLLASLPMIQKQAQAADWARRLREAAMRDAEGQSLDDMLKTIRQL